MILKATKVFQKLHKADTTIIVCRGGARSSKSYSIAQILLLKILSQSRTRILILRKTFPSLRITTLNLVLEIIKEMQLPFNYSYSTHTFSLNGNSLIFSSLDKPEKIKSGEFTDIWMEEANEFSYEDFMQLKLRMSGQSSGMNQMYLSFNPSDERSWIKDLEKREDITLIKSTYKDNPFLSKAYLTEIEKLKNEDENYWKIYGEGEWGESLNLVFSKWNYFKEVENYEDIFYGVDFGYNNPTAIIEVKVKDGAYYISELLFESHLTNTDLIEKMKGMNLIDNAFIYCDSAEPQRIQELCNAGFNAVSSNKDVKNGLNFLKQSKLFIDESSENLINEMQTYSWRKDKDNALIDDVVKYNDHLLDAMRYAIYSNGMKFNQVNFWVR